MLIQLQAVSKSYWTGSMEVPALRHVDLSVRRGEFVAIVGQSGSGKTTLLDILGCLSRPTSGEYRLEGRPVSSLEDSELALVRNRHMGFIFQTFHLLPRKTALQNVELPLQYASVPGEERRRRAQEVLRMVGLEDRMTHRSNQLSGGQQQRVAIARALVNRPTLLLADEPTGSLDSQSGEDILNILRDLHRKGQTILLITHERMLAEAAERIITLRDGHVIADEPMKEHPQTLAAAKGYSTGAGETGR